MTELVITPLRWLRLARYCETTGDTPDAVHARRRKRQWKDGVHCRVGPDGNLWVNPEEVNRWIEGLPPSSEAESSSARAA